MLKAYSMNKFKALLSTIFLIGSCLAIDIPKLEGLVTDKAEVLDAAQEELLENKLEALAANTGISIGVLTIKTLEDYPIEMFTLDVARKSGLGLEDKDTGALYTIAVNDREQRIEVGYGLEGSLTDATTFNIQEDAKPLLSQGDYAGAINQIVDNMILASNGEYIFIERDSKSTSAELTFIDVAIFVVFFMIFFGFLFAKSKKIWHGGVAGGVLSFLFALGKGVPTMAAYTIGGIIIGLVIDYLLSNSKGGLGGGGFTFGGGSSSSGGGFSGFGGGSFGGGGSSSSW